MTRTALFAALVAVVFVASSASTVFAAKPQDVVEWSNGFPSGEHFNLNIHGKKPGYDCVTPEDGGGSVFVPEHGTSGINYVMNKKSDVENLTVHDACAGWEGPNDDALVQLPKGEYQVYARILAKPAKEDEPREVVLWPKLVDACNDDGSEDFANATDCDTLGLGVVTSDGAFDLESSEWSRTKGKSKAAEITELFMWSGYACDASFDTNGDGEITTDDLSTEDADGDGFADGDLDMDGDIDEDDLAIYLAENCVLHESDWVFNIADLVVYGWDYENKGSKLLQIRFYPTDTTEFS